MEMGGIERCLRHLDLSFNAIGPLGAEALYAALESSSLEVLRLEDNSLSDQGAVTLIWPLTLVILSLNCSLRELPEVRAGGAGAWLQPGDLRRRRGAGPGAALWPWAQAPGPRGEPPEGRRCGGTAAWNGWRWRATASGRRGAGHWPWRCRATGG